MWIQRELRLPGFSRGFHLITRRVLDAVPELKEIRAGILHVHILHTSASLSLNENADPTVRIDALNILDSAVPESPDYLHISEGLDDMPAHVKAMMLGNSLSIPIHQGSAKLGIWQGIYLGEHRNSGGPRKLFLTLQGEPFGGFP